MASRTRGRHPERPARRPPFAVHGRRRIRRLQTLIDCLGGGCCGGPRRRVPDRRDHQGRPLPPIRGSASVYAGVQPASEPDPESVPTIASGAGCPGRTELGLGGFHRQGLDAAGGTLWIGCGPSVCRRAFGIHRSIAGGPRPAVRADRGLTRRGSHRPGTPPGSRGARDPAHRSPAARPAIPGRAGPRAQGHRSARGIPP